ncbi:MAG TPA: hypothetical protein VH163_10265 [Gemmatimonadales bacterium]|nr:hypothetical protein [Gemmatimonadales bacterium]
MDNEFQRLADIEVEAVRPDARGFTLTGQGPDHAEYRLDVHFDLPIDARTRAVLGELLSHSGLTISRRGQAPAAPARRRDRAHRT